MVGERGGRTGEECVRPGRPAIRLTHLILCGRFQAWGRLDESAVQRWNARVSSDKLDIVGKSEIHFFALLTLDFDGKLHHRRVRAHLVVRICGFGLSRVFSVRRGLDWIGASEEVERLQFHLHIDWIWDVRWWECEILRENCACVAVAKDVRIAFNNVFLPYAGCVRTFLSI